MSTVDHEIDGLIQRIHVKNFLCHENLIVNLNEKNINWVIGRNGSGKSAILTALIVGLGGKAAATRRGNKIQSFIRNGASSTVISIQIKNNTLRSYNHEKYGDSITIIRKIYLSKGSSYMVKAASGEVVSTKYDDVSSILVALEIQVDNPISVLNQDEARTFCSIDPKKMFSLFRRATNLDHSEINYKRVLENCKVAEETKIEKTRTCAALEKKFKDCEYKYKQLLLVGDMENEMQYLKNEILWSEVAEQHIQIETQQNRVYQETRKCQKLKEKLKNMQQDCAGNSNVIQGLKDILAEIETKKSAQDAQWSITDEAIRNTNVEHSAAQRASNKKREQLVRETRKIAELELEIRNTASGAEQGRREALERLVCEAREAERAAAESVVAAERRLEDATARHERAQARADSDDNECRDAHERVEKLRRSHREAGARGGDPLAPWGADMAELRRRVQRASERGLFSRPPLGPVGFYLRLKEEKWANAVEHIISSTKSTFCVNDSADSRKLFQIMEEVYGNRPKPSVTCSRFLPTQHDVSRRRVQANPCPLDVIEVANPVIANFLIDNLSLERMLLVEDQESAIRLADTESNVPRNCIKIVTEDCTEFYPAPNYRSYGYDSSRNAHHYLRVGTEDGERRLRDALRRAEDALRGQAERVREARAAECTAAQEVREAKAALQALLDARLDRERERRAAERALDRHHSPQCHELESELEKLKRLVETLRGELEAAAEAERAIGRRLKEEETRAAQLKAQLDSLRASARKRREEITKEQSRIDNGTSERQNYERILKEHQDRLMREEEELAKRETIKSDKIKKAAAIGSKVDNPRDVETLQQLLQNMQAKVRAIENLGLDMETVAEDRARLEEEHSSLKELLNKFGILIDQTRKSIKVRMKFCYELEIHITRRVQFSFASILATHNYIGRIEVKHSEGELLLLLSGRDAARRTHQAASLSGGERSYCTVALLLALWDCVELPFYFLDEFDVFMDPVNRTIVVDLLLDFARRHPTRQFVFLSPHRPHGSAQTDTVDIHRLSDPRP